MRRLLGHIMMIGACAGFSISGSAQGLSIGKYAGEFMSIGVGGRALAMGGAYSALATDATGGYWNPAAIAWVDYPQIFAMHDSRFAGIENYDYGAVLIPYGSNATVGISILRLGVDGIPDTRNAALDANGNHVPVFQQDGSIDYASVSYFNAADWAMYFSYGKRASDDFSYGANVKLIRRSLGDAGAFGIGFDAAVLYKATNELTLAANAQDVTTTLLAWSTGTKELISPTLKLGAAYVLLIGTKHRIIPACDLDVRFENRQFASMAHLGPVSIDPHVGFEYTYNRAVSIRAGINDIKQWTVGAGVKLPKLNLDYSYTNYLSDPAEQLGATHRISLMVTLEEARWGRVTN